LKESRAETIISNANSKINLGTTEKTMKKKKSKEKLLNPIDLNIVTLCNAKSLKHNKWKTQEQRSN
jgi:hypothetical protein